MIQVEVRKVRTVAWHPIGRQSTHPGMASDRSIEYEGTALQLLMLTVR
jgi:hypothetical protein